MIRDKFDLIVTDLDGTLLSSKKNIDIETVTYLKDFSSNGGRIALVSGRNREGIKRYISELELCDKDIIISDDGIQAYGAVKDDNIEQRCISESEILYILKEINAFRVYALGVSDDMNFVIGKRKSIFNFAYCIYIYKKYIRKNLSLEFKNYSSLVSRDKNIKKLILFHPQREKIYSKLKYKLASKFKIYNLVSENRIQLMNINAGKEKMLNKVITELKLDKNRVVVFGNDGNDVDMLQEYKYSFCVVNGTNEAKKAAKFITDSCDEKGVLKGLKLILEIGAEKNV